MWRDTLSVFRRLTHHRIAYGEIIPPDARVDPDDYPEKHFPLWCPECDYLLRGLPGPYCPECGRRFDRGRLLVEQYVLGQANKLWRRTSKYAWWTGTVGFMLAAACPALLGLSSFLPVSWLDPITALEWIFRAYRVLIVLMVVGAVLLFASCGLHLHLAFVEQRKCTQVFKGLNRKAPSFQAAQKHKRFLTVVWVFLILAMSAWETKSYEGTFRYYYRQPLRLLLLFALALGVVALLSMGVRLWRRWQDDRASTDESSSREDD